VTLGLPLQWMGGGKHVLCSLESDAAKREAREGGAAARGLNRAKKKEGE